MHRKAGGIKKLLPGGSPRPGPVRYACPGLAEPAGPGGAPAVLRRMKESGRNVNVER